MHVINIHILSNTYLPQVNLTFECHQGPIESDQLFLDNEKIIRLHPPRQGGIRLTLLQTVATTPYSYDVIKV